VSFLDPAKGVTRLPALLSLSLRKKSFSAASLINLDDNQALWHCILVTCFIQRPPRAAKSTVVSGG
jgi:hypothetical protein